jgi:hypothetical protein
MALTMKSLQEQINELRNEVAVLKAVEKTRKIPAGLSAGDTFKLAGLTWTILDITDKGYMCLADRLEDSMKFDSESNNWVGSQLREYLNTEFIEKITNEIGEENIIAFNRNLLSLDGQDEYGNCEDTVSLLTVDNYRKYRSFIPNTDDWWWLATPWSTKRNSYEYSVAVVSPSGDVYIGSCNGGLGVRPFCIFSSEIFESED